MRDRTENAAHLAAMLAGRGGNGNVASLVLQIQALARKAHRNAERMCNGELTECPKCHGDGWDCKACAETGYPTLAREAKAVERLRKALAPYRLRVYEQGDPRGWPLYLIPEESIPEPEHLGEYVYPGDGPNPDVTAPEVRKALRERWIASNYSGRGVAVCPH